MRMIILLILIQTFSFAQDAQLQQLIEQALKNNHQLKARMWQSKAANQLIESAGTLPDPMLSFGLMNVPVNSFAFDQEPMTGKQIAFNQAIPFPGKLSLKAKIKDLHAQKLRDTQKDTELRVIFNVKQLYFKIFYFDRALEVTQKNQRVLKNFIEIARTRYTVGKGIQQDVLKAQVEYARFFDKITTLQEKRHSLVTQLNALVDRPQSTIFKKTEVWPFKTVTLSEDSLKERLIANNPVLKSLEKSLLQSKTKVKLAKRSYWPDFNFTLAYTQRQVLQNGAGGIDYFSAGIGLKIPLYFWKKQRPQLQAQKLEQKQTQETLTAIKLQLEANLSDALQSLTKKAELIELYQKTIIPQASQSLNSAIAGYQNDQIDFLTLLNNLMVVFNYEQEYYRLLSAYYQHLAQIEYLTGKELIK